MHDTPVKATVALEMTVHRADGTVEHYTAPAYAVDADALKEDLASAEGKQTLTGEEQNG